MKLTKNIIVIITLILFLLLPTVVSATSIINPDDYKPGAVGDTTKIENIGNAIVGVINVVGSVVAVGALVAMGIKFMVGSAEEKAEYKKSMIPYLIGFILLFAGSQILSIFYNYMQHLSDVI